jgi:hypothetical protein
MTGMMRSGLACESLQVASFRVYRPLIGLCFRCVFVRLGVRDWKPNFKKETTNLQHSLGIAGLHKGISCPAGIVSRHISYDLHHFSILRIYFVTSCRLVLPSLRILLPRIQRLELRPCFTSAHPPIGIKVGSTPRPFLVSHKLPSHACPTWTLAHGDIIPAL